MSNIYPYRFRVYIYITSRGWTTLRHPPNKFGRKPRHELFLLWVSHFQEITASKIFEGFFTFKIKGMTHFTDNERSDFRMAVREGGSELFVGLGKPKRFNGFFEGKGVGRGHGEGKSSGCSFLKR